VRLSFLETCDPIVIGKRHPGGGRGRGRLRSLQLFGVRVMAKVPASERELRDGSPEFRPSPACGGSLCTDGRAIAGLV